MSLFALPWMILFRKWILRLIVLFFTVSLFLTILFKWVNPGTTLTMISRKMKSENGLQKEWIRIENISRNMQLAVICGEDQNFCDHHGFDLGAIKKAVEHNAKGGKIRGASTISQQTAKNVFLWEGRSYLRKGLEVWFTLLIEFVWGKERIMEVYLNVAETGEDCFGVEAASRRYFKKSANRLTKSEAASIASILPSPRKWKIWKYPANKRQQIILHAMNRYGIELKYLQ